MKIIFEHNENNKVEILTDALDIYDVIDEIEKALIGYGFCPETVKKGFLEKAWRIEEFDRGQNEDET